MKSEADIRNMMRGIMSDIMRVRREVKTGETKVSDAENRLKNLEVKYNTLKSIVE